MKNLFVIVFIAHMINTSLAQTSNSKTEIQKMQEQADRNDAWNSIDALPNIHHSDSLTFVTKSFCDNDQTWRYQITADKFKITIKVFPGEKNTYYKDKSKPTETAIGYIVKENVIATKNDEGKWIQLYWYDKKKLFKYGAEGMIENMVECPK